MAKLITQIPRSFSQKILPFLKTDFGVLLLYFILLVLFFGKYFLTMYLHGDFIAYAVPNYKFILDSLRSGYIPLWQPYSFLGVPELFKLELTLFYPPVWILFIFNLLFNSSDNLTFIGKTIELVQYSNILIGAYGMYFVLRKMFTLSLFSSFLGGIVFGFSVYTTYQTVDMVSLPGKLYFPWIIYFLFCFLQTGKFRYYILLVFVNYLIFTFGYPYYYVYFTIAQLSLATLFGFKKTIITGVALVNAGLLAGFFLLPNLHILQQSFRGVTSTLLDPFFHLRNAFVPSQIVNIFNPMVYESIYNNKDPNLLFSIGMLSWGVFPLVLILIGMANTTFSKKQLWLIFLFIIGIVFSLGGYLNIPQALSLILPMVEKFRSHAQMLVFTFFAGVIFFSQGIDYIRVGVVNRKLQFFLWQAVILLFLLLTFIPFYCRECTRNADDIIISIARSTLLLCISLYLIHLTVKSKMIVFLVLGITLTLFEYSFYYSLISYAHLPVSYQDYYRPNALLVEKPTKNNLFRYSFTENQFIYNTSFLGIFNEQGYETVPYKAFYDLSRFPEDKMLQFTNTKYVVTTQANKEKDLSSLKLVKIVRPRDYPNQVFIGTVNGVAYFSRQYDTPYYIYQVTDYLPRFYVSNTVKTCDNENCYNNTNFYDASYTKEKGILIENPQKSDVVVKTVSYLPNSIRLQILSPAKTFISSSEIWDKGWSISVNGRIAQVFNVNNGFRGFIVPSGKSEVNMSYFPPYVNYGVLMSICGLCMVCLFYIYTKFTSSSTREKKKNH